jgi:hypothetical protein
MAILLKNRLLLRLLAVAVLTLCFVILLRSSANNSMATRLALSQRAQQKVPAIRSQVQPEAPLVISALRTVSWDGNNLEVAMDLVNVSSKSIRGYAIKQALQTEVQSGQVLFTSLDINNKAALQPNQLTTTFDVYQASSSDDLQLNFSVDYVEFSDGTKWGPDSAKSAERSEGQRAAGAILSQRLLKLLNNGRPTDVLSAIERGDANIEPPVGRSPEWKEGFRFGGKSIEQRLKRAQATGRLDAELRELADRFKGGR